MSKKTGRLLLLSAVAGATAAGVYYYLQKKNEKTSDSYEDFDDFDDFDDEIDNEFDNPASHSTSKSRPYVSIDLDNAKEAFGEKAIDTLDKAKEKFEQFNVPGKIDKAKEIISEMTTPAAPTTEAVVSDEVSEDAVKDDATSSEYTSDIDVSSSTETAANSTDSVREEFFDDTNN